MDKKNAFPDAAGQPAGDIDLLGIPSWLPRLQEFVGRSRAAESQAPVQ